MPASQIASKKANDAVYMFSDEVAGADFVEEETKRLSKRQHKKVQKKIKASIGKGKGRKEKREDNFFADARGARGPLTGILLPAPLLRMVGLLLVADCVHGEFPLE